MGIFRDDPERRELAVQRPSPEWRNSTDSVEKLEIAATLDLHPM